MDSFLNFVDAAITPFHTIKAMKSILLEKGFSELWEGDTWSIVPGGSYFVSRNSTSLIAFTVPKGEISSFQMASAHSDTPCLIVKPTVDEGKYYTRLRVEKYGGAILSTWFDRPLSVGGRVFLNGKDGVEERLVDLHDTVVIPSVAIHINRDANSDKPWVNLTSDMMPLLGDAASRKLWDRLAEENGFSEKDVLSSDLYLYSASRAFLWADGKFVTAPRLDDLMCVYGLLNGLVTAKPCGSISVLCVFDHEEMGSLSRQGADSDFLGNTLFRIAKMLSKDEAEYKQMLANSFMISADNGHAVHPNHPELSDKAGGHVLMNQGIVIKHAPAKYATDAFSDALLRKLCEEKNIPTQSYYNRADLPGGRTLANISAGQVSVATVDIGLAQLAMHSAVETAGAEDIEYLCRLARSFFSTALLHKNGAWNWR